MLIKKPKEGKKKKNIETKAEIGNERFKVRRGCFVVAESLLHQPAVIQRSRVSRIETQYRCVREKKNKNKEKCVSGCANKNQKSGGRGGMCPKPSKSASALSYS